MAKRLDDLAPQGLLDRARRAVDLVDAASRIRVFCHYDPDGTTSASILARALMRRGKRIHASMAHALDRASADRLQAESNELLVVSDMGSAQLDLLERLPYPVVVLDHHKPVRDSDTVVHVNPHLDGVDGAREMCGATTTWLFTLVLDDRNWDLAGIAMAGAIGDMQAAGGFVGVNGALFAEAADRKTVVPERRPSLRDLLLAKAIAQSIRPYFRGLSGRPDASAALLKKASFDPDVSLRQLEPAARRKLTSVLAAHLVEQGAAPEALDAIVEDRYWIEPDQIYAQDLEAYVNSCDRLGQEGLGMPVCLGDPEALAKAEGCTRKSTSSSSTATLQATPDPSRARGCSSSSTRPNRSSPSPYRTAKRRCLRAARGGRLHRASISRSPSERPPHPSAGTAGGTTSRPVRRSRKARKTSSSGRSTKSSDARSGRAARLSSCRGFG